MKRVYFAVVFALFVAVALASGQATAHGDLSAADIERILSAKVPADVIAMKVKQAGTAFNLGAEDIIALKKAGASGALLRLMLDPAGTSGGGSTAEGHDVTIPDGTEVKLLLKNPLSSATAQSEQRIEFTASDAVVVHGLTVIEKGAPAVGHVTEVEARKSFGRKGKPAFTIDTVQAVSGEHLRLRASKAASGADSYGTAGVLTILTGPLGALVKGKDVDVAAGTEGIPASCRHSHHRSGDPG